MKRLPLPLKNDGMMPLIELINYNGEWAKIFHGFNNIKFFCTIICCIENGTQDVICAVRLSNVMLTNVECPLYSVEI